MIREKFDIDNRLIIEFIKSNKFDTVIEEEMFKWYAFLDDKDYEKGRVRAVDLIKHIASEALLEINFPEEEKEGLLEVFNPLESLLRTAQSLNNSSKNIKVRDHLSHTIRDLIFANYLLRFFHNNSLAHLKRKLFTAVIFHDIGYPIEKLKKIGNNLKDATFSELLNSSGKVDFILSRPDDLLDMIDQWGRYSISDNLASTAEDNTRIQNKIRHIYEKVLAPAIAGQGLFDSSHNLSSVILFLKPILSSGANSKKYVQAKMEIICDICLAIAYHDRKLSINDFLEYNTEVPILVKILRIADELQEWDRVKNEESFVKDVEIDFLMNYLSIKYTMKHSKYLKCDPNKFLPDKIVGLAPVINNDILELTIEFPEEFMIQDDSQESLGNLILTKEYEHYVEYYTKGKTSNRVKLSFNNLRVKIELL